MRTAPRWIWIVLFLFAGVAAVAGVSRLVGTSRSAGAGLIPWRVDYAAATEQAAKDRRPVLLYFTAEWCDYCRKMDGEAWSDARVAAAVHAGYLPVKVDIDQDPDLAKRFGVQGVPRVDVLPPDGPATTVADGYVPAPEMLQRLTNKSAH